MPRPSDAAPAALLRSLRDGTAGFIPRAGLSFAAAAAGVGALMLIFGVLEASKARVRDEHVAFGVLGVIVCWLGLLYPLWATYSSKRHVVRTILICVGAMVLTIGVATTFGIVLRTPEFFIAGTIFLGVSAIAGVVTSATFRGGRGRAIAGADGVISVSCPVCGYSMAGLDACACPECGTRFTLDELIRAQNYEALRLTSSASSRPAPRAALPHSEVTARVRSEMPPGPAFQQEVGGAGAA